MICTVMQTDNDKAVILTKNGNFITVKNKNYKVGQRINYMPLNNPYIQSIAAACLMLAITGTGATMYMTPYSYMSIDINPSIQLELNRFERVIGTSAFNDEGSLILDNVKIMNTRADKSVEKIINAAKDGGYLSGEDKSVIINIADKSEKIENELSESIKEYSDIDIVIEDASYEDAEMSENMNVSIGKIKYMREYSEAFGGDFEKNKEMLENTSVKEVREIVRAVKNTESVISETSAKIPEETPVFSQIPSAAPVVSPENTKNPSAKPQTKHTKNPEKINKDENENFVSEKPKQTQKPKDENPSVFDSSLTEILDKSDKAEKKDKGMKKAKAEKKEKPDVSVEYAETDRDENAENTQKNTTKPLNTNADEMQSLNPRENDADFENEKSNIENKPNNIDNKPSDKSETDKRSENSSENNNQNENKNNSEMPEKNPVNQPEKSENKTEGLPESDNKAEIIPPDIKEENIKPDNPKDESVSDKNVIAEENIKPNNSANIPDTPSQNEEITKPDNSQKDNNTEIKNNPNQNGENIKPNDSQSDKTDQNEANPSQNKPSDGQNRENTESDKSSPEKNPNNQPKDNGESKPSQNKPIQSQTGGLMDADNSEADKQTPNNDSDKGEDKSSETQPSEKKESVGSNVTKPNNSSGNSEKPAGNNSAEKPEKSSAENAKAPSDNSDKAGKAEKALPSDKGENSTNKTKRK